MPDPTPTYKIVALADRGPGYDTSRGNWQTTKLYHVTQGIVADAASAVADWGERNFGDPQTLIDFVTWTKANYPADHYALYFWGHGWNWHPGWVMEDDTNVDTLDYHEMKAAIPQLGFIDVVGYDGCNMATMEIYKLWQNKATAVAASEEYVGWNGIEYDSVIAQLRANPFMSADQVAVATRAVGDRPGRRAHLVGGGRGRDGSTNLLTATEQFAVALTNGLAANRKKYDRAFGATRSMWQAPMDKDLYDMANEINIGGQRRRHQGEGAGRDECDHFSQCSTKGTRTPTRTFTA